MATEDCAKAEYVDLVASHVREITELKIVHVRELGELRAIFTERALTLAAEAAKWRTGLIVSVGLLIVTVAGIFLRH